MSHDCLVNHTFQSVPNHVALRIDIRSAVPLGKVRAAVGREALLEEARETALHAGLEMISNIGEHKDPFYGMLNHVLVTATAVQRNSGRKEMNGER
ncbi:MAG: hypothetical protein KGL39_13995 [Patescibacteria group bacterium]|nr:hypothetical protein [Patescibacteria group bacterium]